MALLGSFGVELRSFPKILFNSIAPVESKPELKLSVGVTLVGGLSKSFQNVQLGHTTHCSGDLLCETIRHCPNLHKALITHTIDRDFVSNTGVSFLNFAGTCSAHACKAPHGSRRIQFKGSIQK
jgi:hypothetical protein